MSKKSKKHTGLIEGTIERLSSRIEKTRVGKVASELSAIIIMVFASFIELAHIAHSSWLNMYLYNGDSLTLPIIRQSLARKEEILWVFSAQLNLFPEGVLYALSSMLGHSIRASLAVNTVLNIVLFYVMIRLIIRVVATSPRLKQQVWSVLCALVLVCYTLLEAEVSSRSQSYVSYYTLTTYYYGVILVGMFAIYATMRLLKRGKVNLDRSYYAYVGVITALTTLTVTSNPLYVVQILLPIFVVLGALFALKLTSVRLVALLCVPHILGIVLGLIARQTIVRGFIGQTLGGHLENPLNLKNWYDSIFYMSGVFAPQGSLIGTKIRILLCIAVYYFALFYVLLKINRRLKDSRVALEPLPLFITLFAVLQPLITAACLAGLNEVQQRYLITSLIIPIIGLGVLVNTQFVGRAKQYTQYAAIAILAAVLIGGSFSLMRIKPLLSSYYPDEHCLAAALDYKPANGVADYWTARALDVYSMHGERTLQVMHGLTVFSWLNNIASYQNKDFSYLVTSKDETRIESIPQDSFKSFGKASKFSECPNFYVYQYYPGTDGHKRLNAKIHDSLKDSIYHRKHGDISDYNWTQKQPKSLLSSGNR